MQANAALAQASSADALTAQLGAVIHHVMSRDNGETLTAMDDLGISLSQVKALGVLDARGEQPLKAVGEALGLSLPAVSRSVDGLVKRKWVTREECPEDRRSKLVRITREGSETIRQLTELRLSGLRSFVDSLSEEELDALVPALELLARRPEIATHCMQRTSSDD